MKQGHTEFFGPDLGRGPFASQRIETAVLQIATALAQVRAPLGRADNDLRTHVDFIRELADRLAPDWAAQIVMDVGEMSGSTIPTSICAVTGTYSLLDCWLADAPGGGLTTSTPTSVTFTGGTILQTIATNRRYLIVTPSTGAVVANVSYSGGQEWYWAVTRYGRVYYSSSLYFY